MTRERRVGIFVTVGLIITTVAIFLIGQNRKFWQRKVRYEAVYSQVAGLKAGSPVSMGGVDVGVVGEVRYSDDANNPKIYVYIDVVREQAPRIRKDVFDADGKTLKYPGTVARVVNKGLLGDKMIELSIADTRAPVLEPPGPLSTAEPLDLNAYVAKFDAMAQKADTILGNLEHGTEPLKDPAFADDLKATIKNLRTISDGIAHGDGPAHRLLFDKNEADRIDRILGNTERSTARLDAVLADTQDVTHQVKTGPGIAHALLYDGDMSANVAGSLAEVHKDLEQIRTGNGLAHALLYGDADSQHLMKNVDAMSDDLRVIVANLRAGKGTLGALLVDPSIYEDIKSLVGNVERNQVLRALVRYSIKEDELKTPPPPAPTVTDPKPTP
jgi:phospholipid/cholesterol/gamma-HCH transport system substrate-binding protein